MIDLPPEYRFTPVDVFWVWVAVGRGWLVGSLIGWLLPRRRQ